MPKGKKKSCKALKTSEEGGLSGFVLNRRLKINDKLARMGLHAGAIMAHLLYQNQPVELSVLCGLTNGTLENVCQVCGRLIQHGFIHKNEGKYSLTDQGRKEMLILRSYMFPEQKLPVGMC
ncbi:MAG TPA: hypothetical protein PJ995_21810 [Cyclobacteriaceae bacterium]|nr:hypothetical protein [Cyclobacteriaceae bacterium]